MKHLTRSMTSGPLFSGIITYTIPIILTSILQLLFNAADIIVVGRFCGSLSVAAVSATGTITNLLVNLFIGLSMGSGVTVAHGLGKNDAEEIHNAIHSAIPLAILCGAFLMAFGIVFTEDFLVLMNTPDSVLPLSKVYMQIYFGGMLFSMLYNFSSAILRAAGDTKSPLRILVHSGITNVVLNVMFVTVFHLNVAGVALATVISQGISAVLVILKLLRRNDCCKLELKKLKFRSVPVIKILKIGIPAGIQSCLYSISNVIIQSSINSFNSEALISGNGAASNIEGFVYVILNAFYQTALNFTGQNAGAHKFDRIKKTIIICTLSMSVCGITVSSLIYRFADKLLGFYIVDSAEAIQYGITRMTYICQFYTICGIVDILTGGQRGLSSSLIPMMISLIGICAMRIIWVYTIFQLPQYHTPDILYTSYPVSWSITLVAQFAAFLITFRKKTKNAMIM